LHRIWCRSLMLGSRIRFRPPAGNEHRGPPSVFDVLITQTFHEFRFFDLLQFPHIDQYEEWREDEHECDRVDVESNAEQNQEDSREHWISSVPIRPGFNNLWGRIKWYGCSLDFEKVKGRPGCDHNPRRYQRNRYKKPESLRQKTRQAKQSVNQDCGQHEQRCEKAEDRHSDRCEKCPSLFGTRRCPVEEADPTFTKYHGCYSFSWF
jgi:hypothetical protein